MTQLPEESYKVIRQVFDVLQLSDEDRKQYEERFEQMLLNTFAMAIVKKLPDKEGKEIKELANSAKTPEKKQELQKKLEQWLNPEEIKALLQKVADKLFLDFVKVAYKDATETEKKQLEEMFKSEVLRG